MRRILKSICLISTLLLCINCGVADSANTTVPHLTVLHDGGVSDEGGAGGDTGAGGFAGTLSVGGQSTGGFAGTVNVAGASGHGNCHRLHHHCDLDTHKCN